MRFPIGLPVQDPKAPHKLPAEQLEAMALQAVGDNPSAENLRVARWVINSLDTSFARVSRTTTGEPK